MRTNYSRIIAMLLVLVMIASMLLTGCINDNTGRGNQGGNEGGNEGGDYVMPEDEYTIPKEEGYNQLTFYWSHPGVI